jgi:hypothetical protein
LSDKEQQIENDKDVGGNKEAKKKENERGRRLNYQLSVIAKERHVEKEAVCHRKEEEMSDTQIIIIIKYS